MVFNEDTIIRKSVEELEKINIKKPEISVEYQRITSVSQDGIDSEFKGNESKTARVEFAPTDFIEEISENTSLSYRAAFKILNQINNKKEMLNNPPAFIREASKKIKDIELDEMLRALTYRTTGEEYDLAIFEPFILKNTDKIEPTPNRGIYDHIIYDSDYEKAFAHDADIDTEVVCFLKLPTVYKIKTPAGEYNPDFGLVLKKKKIRDANESEYYFIIETKGTNDIDDRKALTENEIYKIKCAIKHFEALGIEAKIDYVAPVKDYKYFKNQEGSIERP